MASTAAHFFFSRAGYSYPTGADAAGIRAARWDGARQLAQAERWAGDEGLIFAWVDDPDCTEDDFEHEADKAYVREHGAVGCVLYRPCPDHGIDCRHAEVLASLWGITESLDHHERDAYRRVVQAELAAEARAEQARA